MNISNYLSSKYKSKTAKSYYAEWLDFEIYLTNQGRNASNSDYNLVLDYVARLQSKTLSPRTINRKLMIIEQVFEGLKLVEPNPVRALRLKNATEKPLPEPIPYSQLSQYLSEFQKDSLAQHRNYILLSLLHHQALCPAELSQLKINDIKLSSGELQVPSVLRNQPRRLDLLASQILDLQYYINKIRPQFDNSTDLLFIPSGGAKSLNNSLMKLKSQLQKQLPKLQNLAHWRSSVIVHWLDSQSLLAVQKKLGHRYPSSTERYKIHVVKSLQEELNLHHPLH
jgi:integrase/recombinase XerD